MIGVGITYHFTTPKKNEAKEEPKAAEAQPQPTPEKMADAPPVQTMESTQAKLAEVLDVKKTANGLMINLKSDSFAPNSAELSPDAKENIGKAGKLIAQNPNQKVRVEGYTDSSGPKQKNIELSQKRAESVKAVLVDNGVKTENISTQGFGSEKPVADNKTPDGRKVNRRVEIYVDEGNKQ
jgi:outer membrane protein OmpA-like peptidoglycan-associated protein